MLRPVMITKTDISSNIIHNSVKKINKTEFEAVLFYGTQ